MGQPTEWWRSAVIYQVYVRSFADGDGDGTGDLAGVRARLPYLAELGVDALWFNPWYLSPMKDGGYDVADYRAIDPAFGTLAEAEKLIAEARELGIRTIVDIVPNHVSDQHPWFRAALKAGPGSPERELFHFRRGRGKHGELPPNDWPSQFVGSAEPVWTRLPDGDWYLHLFTPEQPDLNWAHPAVRQEHEDILRFWFERRVAGVRIDSAALLAKDPALPDLAGGPDPHPFVDRDELHDIYRSWRAIADEYDGVFVGEVWLPDTERFARYLRPDELHTAFNFSFLSCPWDAAAAAHLDRHDPRRRTPRSVPPPPGCCATTTSPARSPATAVRTPASTSRPRPSAPRPTSTSAPGVPARRRCSRSPSRGRLRLPGRGTRPARGGHPARPHRGPMHVRSGGKDPGRDGCRVPLPWTAGAPHAGFGGEPWLPQPADWASYAVDRQAVDPGSMLSLYREAVRIRPVFGDGPLTWLPAPEGVLAFARAGGARCVVNLAGAPVDLPEHTALLLASGRLDAAGRLPTDTAVWLRS